MICMTKAIKNLFIALGLFCVNAGMVFAQNDTTKELRSIPRAYKPALAPDVPGAEYDVNVVNIFLQFLAGNVIFFAGAVAVLLLVYAGGLYVTAMGDDGQMEKAKKTITWTFIGLGAMVISYAAVQFVITFFLGLPS